MRSRLAILGTLVLGMVLSTGGAGLAVSGFASHSQNAAGSEYGTATPYDTPDDQPGSDVLGQEQSGGSGGSGGTSPSTDTQPTRQVESGAQGTGNQQLPFTGFAAIPILLGGVALLATGLVLRRRTADDG